MEISVGELLELNRIMNELSNQKLNTILAYKMARILKKVEAEVTTAEESRIKTIMPFIKKDEDGNPIINNDSNTYETIEGKQNEISQALNEFFSTKIKLDLPTLNLKELEQIQLTPRQVEVLMPIIDEE